MIADVGLLVSNRKRAILALSVVPLMAFSCATVDALRVMPSRYREAVTAGAYTVSLASADYTDVAKVVEGWAVAEGFQKSSCDGSNLGTPLCQKFSRDSQNVTVAYSTGDNYIDVIVVDWSSGIKAGETSKALRAEIGKRFGAAAVRGRYEK